ncbi:Alpha/beta hydrolase family protein [Roseivivax sp. THAF40]|uniref:alpha/beta hydrolase family esterase n=1 Tax=unclassified Roseivivax TaxID=2639302 RepID=UPI001268C369|nr:MULTISPECIES: hypothetical protein [unclassified Roseivivax]QFS84164.1 Alpha/beta hydrolase family protein [Roseivivax sp. THAF197b]QFT47992.1 Alpha/beta hydrolase family protein [Roseivivax sp. THAF40]
MSRFRIAALTITAVFLVACTASAVRNPEPGVSNSPIRDAIRARAEERRAERQSDGGIFNAGGGAGVGAGASTSDLQLVSFSFQGRERSYFVDPATTGAGKSVVLVFHGGEGDGTKAQRITDLAGLARQQGFTAVFPNSPGQQWNDGRETTASGIDDVGYTRAMLNDLRSRFGTDTSRAFAAGMSNGGMFVQRLACDAPGLFRAYAVIAANIPANLASRCNTAPTSPMIFFNGTDDRIMPFGGGQIASSRMLGAGAGGSVLSNAETRDFWSRINNCGPANTSAREDRVADETKLQLISYDCANGVDLRFYQIEGGGHTWPDSDMGGSFITGAVSREISATSASLGFFRGYGL